MINNQIINSLFNFLKDKNNKIKIKELKLNLKQNGLLKDDPRLKILMEELENSEENIDEENFTNILKKDTEIISLLLKCYQHKMIIPNFNDFTEDIKKIYNKCLLNTDGKIATYIPGLAKIPENKFGLSITTIDGQRYNIGDSNDYFCLQSCSKIINYCLAIEKHGIEKVHKHVGREPSGNKFNALILDKSNRPHNPCINAGAIMTCALLEPEENPSEKYDELINIWEKLSGNIDKIGFNNGIYISEKDSADRNWSLAYFMKEHNAFPGTPHLRKILEFYFQCCSIETNTKSLSIVGSTLANGGINPLTNEKIFSSETVRYCLSIMSFAGMYDYSGEFGFLIGLPAKSGVAGGIILVVPNLMGVAIWSPKLDEYGNSVRGIDFCNELVKTFNFHVYDNLINFTSEKKDPRKNDYINKINNLNNEQILNIVSKGNISELKRLILNNVDLNYSDYDGRTAFHLACSNGYYDIVKLLVENNINIDSKDRWGNTGLDDAKREKQEKIVEYLENYRMM